jgi:phosphoserine phosphatase
MKDKKIIILDIDRTIYDGSIGQDFIIELVNQNLISPKILADLSFELLEYELDIQTYAKTVRDSLTLLSSQLDKKDYDKVKEVAKNVIMYNHYKFFDYVFEIPKVFKDFDFVLLSLEPQILVKEIAEYLKIPNYICNEFPITNNIISKAPSIIIDKKELLEKSPFSSRNVIAAFGDSENDLPILEQAQLKIVINPTPNLLTKIQDKPNYHITNPKLAYDEFKKRIINYF